ncbi:uncharacterized protein LOC116603761 [Nematostella vectensis]|uniref:uncharacterized protein LOC116603761 n=1 Tax=Nematostella vectensis TaxID=45351 RepID=UPI0020778A5F|nr:uncharacterized protein LOC116603761 [Nematostella vectensis]
MALLLPSLSKGGRQNLLTWQKRRSSIAPVGKLFRRPPQDIPEEQFDVTAVGLSERSRTALVEQSTLPELPRVEPDTPARYSVQEGKTPDLEREEICTTPVLPGLPSLPSDRRHGNLRPRQPVALDFTLKGHQAHSKQNLKSLSNTPGGTALKKICSQLEPFLDNLYAEIPDFVEEEGKRVLFIKKMRIYLEISRKLNGPDVLCVPIFHCPRCLQLWTLTGVTPVECPNKSEPTRGPEVLMRERRARFVSMSRGMNHPDMKLGVLKTRGQLLTPLEDSYSTHTRREQDEHEAFINTSYDNEHDRREDTESVARGLEATLSGHVALTGFPGGSIKIDRDALIDLDLDHLTDEQALEVLLEKGAIKNAFIEELQEKKKHEALRVAQLYMSRDEQYDEYARVMPTGPNVFSSVTKICVSESRATKSADRSLEAISSNTKTTHDQDLVNSSSSELGTSRVGGGIPHREEKKRDVESDVQLMEFAEYSPSLRSSTGSTSDEESDAYSGVSSASPKSRLSFSDLQEVLRLPVSNAFTFSFFDLPKQHRAFNSKIKQTVDRIGNKNKRKSIRKKI